MIPYRTLITPQFTVLNLDTTACQRLIRRTFSLHELPSLLKVIFASKDEIDMVLLLRGDDAQAFVDVVDEVRFTFARHITGPD